MIDFGKWMRVFDYNHLEKFFKDEKGKGTIRGAVERIVLATIIAQAPVMIVYLIILFGLGSSSLIAVLMGSSASAGSALLQGVSTPMIAGTIILFSIIGVAISLILFLLTNWTQHMIAKFLGGKGEYSGMLHMLSFVIAMFAIISLVTNLISIGGSTVAGGVVNCCIGLFSLATVIYMIYCNYLAVRVNYGLTGGRALGTVILNMLVWVIACAILFMLIYVATLGLAVSGVSAL